jgi:hypothetical protein
VVELDQLCRWLARPDRIRPPLADRLFPDWTEGEMRAQLTAAAGQAVAEGTLSVQQAATWCAFWGLDGSMPVGRAALAQAAGISPVAVYKRRRRAAEVVAGHLNRHQPTSPPSAQAQTTVSTEEALATLHAELAVQGKLTGSINAAIADLRQELLGVRLSRQFPGTDKYARARARRLIRQRLPGLLHPARPPVIGPAAKASADEFAELIAQAEPLYWARDPRVHEVLAQARAQLKPGVLGGCLDPRDEARLWSVQARLWREEEDIRTVWASQQVERLLGSHAALSVQARADAAIALEEHGYLIAAERCVAGALENLRATRLSDEPGRRTQLGGLVTRAVAISTRRLLTEPQATRSDWSVVQTRLNRLLGFIDQHADEPIAGWALVAYRRRVQLDMVRALRQRLEEGYRQGLSLPLDTDRYIQAAATEAARTPGEVWKISWRMTLLALQLERGDPDAFAAVALEVAALLNASPWRWDNQVEKYQRLVGRAIRRRDQAWQRLAHPDLSESLLTAVEQPPSPLRPAGTLGQRRANLL